MAKEPQTVDKGDIRVIGIQAQTTMKNSVNDVSALWGEVMKRNNEIPNKVGNNVIFGIHEFSEMSVLNENTPFTYMVSLEVNNTDSVPQGMLAKTLAPAKYAVFTHKGPMNTIGDSYSYIYKTWFPQSGNKVKASEYFEYYDNRFRGPNDPNSQVDIYIPMQ